MNDPTNLPANSRPKSSFASFSVNTDKVYTLHSAIVDVAVKVAIAYPFAIGLCVKSAAEYSNQGNLLWTLLMNCAGGIYIATGIPSLLKVRRTFKAFKEHKEWAERLNQEKATKEGETSDSDPVTRNTNSPTID